MPPLDGGRGLTAWFVRRAGLARCTTIAAVVGLSLAAFFPGRPLVAFSGLALALMGILAGHVVSRLRPLSHTGLALTLASVVLVGLFAGLLVGTLRVSSLLDGVLSSRVGETVEAEIVVTGPVRSNAGWQSATAVVQTISRAPGRTEGSRGGAGAGERVLFELAPPKEAAAFVLTQGALLSVRGTIRAPEGASASGFDQAKQLLHQGIQVVLRVEGPADLFSRGQRGGVSGWFDRLRASAKEHLSHGPDRRVNEVLQGVVMGDTVGIDQGWMDAFRRSGTAHMLSVSGLHVASLAAIIIALAGFARLSRKAGFVAAAAAAVLMVPFVGSSPPILRSAVMIVVVLGGRLVGRRRDQWQGLAFAALVVLALNPFAIFDVGFQLSFCAFAGMVALVGPLERLLHRFPDSVRANLAVSLAATLGTAPVSFLVFGRTSLISPLANLLVVPTLAGVTGLGMASVLLGFIWKGFSAGLDTLASLPMSWTILVSTFCARAPVLGAGDLGRVLFAVAAGALVLPAALALSGRTVSLPFGLRLPGFGRSAAWLRAHRPRDRRRAAALGIASMVAALILGAAAYPAAAVGVRSAELFAGARGWPTQVEVRVLDVGQGTAVLVRTPEHHAALFDGGPAGCGLAGQLRALGVRRLDLVVISHPHADHFGGLLEALDSLQVGTFVDRTEVVRPAAPAGPAPASAGSTSVAGAGKTGGAEANRYLELRRRLAAGGSRLLQATPGGTLAVDGVRILFYAPARPLVLIDGGDPWAERAGPPSGDELNGGSLVALLGVGQAEVLLPGDAEADVLSTYSVPKLSAIVVGHHGSRGAVSRPLLAALQGKLALISVGRNNTFGHPDRSTIALLGAAGDTVIRTDECGWVSLRLKDAEMTISTERTRAP
jgi:competence protein ComEC